ncbi:unnamed protein product [Auanema sp. JU1783]|nr:unnamed protein product [Auanema sp. JU1783]
MCCVPLFLTSVRSSTSRLFAQRKAITEEPTEEIPKRFASTEGRFSIIDEHSKDSESDSDTDAPLPNFQQQRYLQPNFSKSVDYSHTQGAMAASRFRIVPVESKYKRGRWNCFDYYEKDAICSKSPKMSCPGPSPFKPVTPKNDRSVRSLTEMAPPATAPATQQVTFNFDISSDSDRENSEPNFSQSQRGFMNGDSKLIIEPPCNKPSVLNTMTITSSNSKNIPSSQTELSEGRMTPTEILQNGLETTLKTSEIKIESEEELQTTSTSSNNNGTSPALVAIDSKIEQAMDLVKTHLMFAVREEVEVLRSKIVDLETHIHHLETENSILKDHIPDDLLKNLNLGKNCVDAFKVAYVGRVSCEYEEQCAADAYLAQCFYEGLIDAGVNANGMIPNKNISFVFLDPYDILKNTTAVSSGNFGVVNSGQSTKTALRVLLDETAADPLISLVGYAEDCRAVATLADTYDKAAVINACSEPIGESVIPLQRTIHFDRSLGMLYRAVAHFLQHNNIKYVHVVNMVQSTYDMYPSLLLDALGSYNIQVGSYEKNIFAYNSAYFPFESAIQYVLSTYLRTRIYVCMGHFDTLALAYGLDKLGLLESGKYLIINVNHFEFQDDLSSRWTTARRERFTLSINQMAWLNRHVMYFTYSPYWPALSDNQDFLNLQQRLTNSFKKPLCPPFCNRDNTKMSNITLGSYLRYDQWITAYDSGKLLGETLQSMTATNNASEIIDSMRQKSYRSLMNYDTFFDEAGISQKQISIWGYLESGTDVTFNNFMLKIGQMTPLKNGSFDIVLNMNESHIYLKEMPKDRPECGFNNENCMRQSGLGTTEIIVIVISSILALGMLGFMGYIVKWIAYERRLESSYYLLTRRDVLLQDLNNFGSSRAGSLMTSMLSIKSTQSVNMDVAPMPGTMEFYTTNIRRAYKRRNNNNDKVDVNTDAWKDIVDWQLAKLDNVLVTVRKVQKDNLKLTREMKREIDLLMSCGHENLNKFHGIIIEPELIFTVHSYGLRKSLNDLVRNPDLRLDRMFKVSFIEDVTKGLRFLHDKSKIGYHGNLKSTNCIVDAYWRVKLSSFGMERIRVDEPLPRPDDMLWFAPEIIRRNCKKDDLTKEELAMADIYSLGIILYEVYGREGPFGDDLLDSTEIVEQLKNGSTENQIRPDIEIIRKSPSVLIEMVEACWQEIPTERPVIRKIRDRLKPLSKGLKGNIADNIMELLDRYRYNLEDVIKERTDELEEERRRNERLLLQLLPSSVADSLKNGRPVDAEFYDCVTIYFSDIVGFTALSSKSTPMQVVNMLNDLYTDFDKIIDQFDCYKVETIGDAYMYVSGLPTTNGIHHAGEVASASWELLQNMSLFKVRHAPEERLRIRIGLHSGPVVTGVVGVKMPRYCLFGDTVITASNMESSGEALKIQLSVDTYRLLTKCGGYEMQHRGEIQLASKIMMESYWLHAYNPETRIARLQASSEKFPQFHELLKKSTMKA